MRKAKSEKKNAEPVIFAVAPVDPLKRAREIAVEEVALMEAKNKDYAEGGPFFGNFERAASIMALYPGIDPRTREGMAVCYAMKQLDAVLHNLSQGSKTNVETLSDKLRDISIYFGQILRMMIEGAGGWTVQEGGSDE